MQPTEVAQIAKLIGAGLFVVPFAIFAAMIAREIVKDALSDMRRSKNRRRGS